MPDFIANTGAISVTAATAKSVISVITTANRRARIKEISVGASSVTSTDAPMLVELVQHDTDGTGSAVTARALDPADAGAAVVTSKDNYTAEPTGGIVVRKEWLVPPSGTFVIQNPLGEEDVCPVSKTMTVRVTSPQNQTVRGYLKFAE
jgi:hypothetical protein